MRQQGLSMIRWYPPFLGVLVGATCLAVIPSTVSAESAIRTVAAPVPSSGGSVVLPQMASVTFPPQAFVRDTHVRLSATASLEVQADFEATASIFGPQKRLPYEFRVNSGEHPPAKDFVMTITLPNSFLRSLPPDALIGVFGQVYEEGGEEILDSFQMFHSEKIQSRGKVRAALPREVFTNKRGTDGTYEAIVIVAALLASDRP